MEPHYSAFADLLNKFQAVAPAIQALWLVAAAGTVLGVTWLVMRGLRDIAAAIRRPGREAGDLLVYGVVQDASGQWQVIRHGAKPRHLDWRNPPRELVGRTAGG
jgi:hypothetical protein